MFKYYYIFLLLLTILNKFIVAQNCGGCTIDASAAYSVLLAGSSTSIKFDTYGAAIITGASNEIGTSVDGPTTGYFPAILTGTYNSIYECDYSAIITGNYNSIQTSSGFSTIVGGEYNTIASGSRGSSIITGDYNYISDSDDSTIIGSHSTIESGASGSQSIGRANEITGSFSTCIGNGCKITHDNAVVITANSGIDNNIIPNAPSPVPVANENICSSTSSDTITMYGISIYINLYYIELLYFILTIYIYI